MTASKIDLLNQYVKDITDGTIPACQQVKNAVKRHLDDLSCASSDDESFPYVFNEEKAEEAINTFSYFRHTKGPTAGKAFDLSPWQAFIVGSIHGWRHKETGFRRFKSAYIEVSRKNGKSTMMSGLALYALTKDEEATPEIFSVATKKEQARISLDEARRCAQVSPALKKRLVVTAHAVENYSNFGKFTALSSDSNTLDGLNPHLIINDEFHAQKDGNIYDVLASAMGARSQALMLSITTAGFNLEGKCYEVRQYVDTLLAGNIKDDSFFGIIYTIDKEDGWDNPENFIKANPNLGVSISEDYLMEQLKQAQNMPSSKVNFITKHLCRWMSSSTLWANAQKWRECKSKRAWSIKSINKKTARHVFLGLDLSTTTDITAISGIAEMNDLSLRVFSISYLPRERVESTAMNKKNYVRWAESGHLKLTEGNTIDYDVVKNDIIDLINSMPVKEIAYDSWNSTHLVTQLQEEDAPLVPFGQGYKSMSPATKELERLYLDGNIEHNNNPVLNWAISNIKVVTDPAGNVKPVKSGSELRIDPAVALIMAVGRYSLHANENYSDEDFDSYIRNPYI